MAKEAAKKEKSESDGGGGKSGGGRFKWFVIGILLGGTVGVAAGWLCRPPDSFNIDQLRAATERKLENATDQSREKLADFAEDLAERLRNQAK